MPKKGSKNFWNKRRGVRSGLEGKIKEDLESRRIKYEYETLQLRYVKKVCQHCNEVVEYGTYTPDFIISRDSGIPLIIEAKGYFDAETRTKMQRIKRDNSDRDIRMVFQRDQPIRKGSKTSYSMWCIKNGYPWHIGKEIPEEWINESESETISKMSGGSQSAVQNKRAVQRVEKKISKKKTARRKVHKVLQAAA